MSSEAIWKMASNAGSQTHPAIAGLS